MKKISVIISGCGNRGSDGYGKVIEQCPEKYEVVAVADPVDAKRNDMKRRFNLPEERCFRDWKDVATQEKMADMVIIATQDYMHTEPALTYIEKGYDILLEKPMAPTPEECMQIVAAAKKHNTKILVCHVLRYTPFYTTVKKLLNEEVIGEVRVINHSEDVGNVHQSHSFVRGNWRNSKETSPMILAKSCHDTDLLQWLIGSKCKKVQSFGSLSYFNKDHAPEGAPDHCTDGCPHADTCFYNAVKIYYDDKKNHWMRSVATQDPKPTDEQVLEALKNGPYGRCVFKCDNDVVDHQTLNMEFENGETVVFTMTAFTHGGRFTKIMGTKGEMTANSEDDHITVYTFADRKYQRYEIENCVKGNDLTSGHGGGDSGIMASLYDYLNDAYDGFSICDIEISALNHLTSFAAEDSRVNGSVTIDIEDYAKSKTK